MVGSNASGKSNFIHIFEFLRDIVGRAGLKNSISMQGDIEYFRNINLKSSVDFSLEIYSDQELRTVIPVGTKKGKKEAIGIKTSEIVYRFTLEFYKEKADFKIAEDILNIKCVFVKLEKQNGEIKEIETLGKGELSLINDEGKVKYDFPIPKEVPLKKEELIPIGLTEEELPSKTLLIETTFLFIPFNLIRIFESIAIYNFDPKKPKKAIPISGKTELEEDGSNLAIVLNNIREDKDKKRKFSNLIKDVLPFVEDLDVVKFVDTSLFVKLKEIYSEKEFLPASLISDGTINIASLIIALYFEEEPLVIIEEPERNIHPYLISKVVDMMKEVSNKRQIITTTHNPEMLKYVDLKDILLVSRDKNGFSKIYRPSEKKEIKAFLKNDLGIDEIFTNNLLGIGHEL